MLMRTGELGFARTAGLSLLGIACLFCGACERSQERVAEAPIPRNGTPFAAPRTNPPGVPAAPLMPLPEASVRDVQELLARVFAGVVALDRGRRSLFGRATSTEMVPKTLQCS